MLVSEWGITLLGTTKSCRKRKSSTYQLVNFIIYKDFYILVAKPKLGEGFAQDIPGKLKECLSAHMYKYK